VKKLIIALFLIMSMSAHASTNVESVVLNDGTMVNGNEILNTHFIPLTNKIDFIELFEGSRIESNDIQTVNFKTLLSNKFLKTGIQVQARATRIGGDGSGG
jgi:hypothetical protein